MTGKEATELWLLLASASRLKKFLVMSNGSDLSAGSGLVELQSPHFVRPNVLKLTSRSEYTGNHGRTYNSYFFRLPTVENNSAALYYSMTDEDLALAKEEQEAIAKQLSQTNNNNGSGTAKLASQLASKVLK